MLRAEKLVIFCSFSPCDALEKEKFANFALHLKKTMEKHFCLDDSPTFRMIELDEVDSTNTFLRNLDSPDDQRMTLVTAEFQSAGRGSGENHWESAKGENLLFSLRVMPSNLPVCRMFAISEATAMAIKESLDTLLSLTPPKGGWGVSIKWPNDIYFEDSKVAGMLIENDLQGAMVRRSTIGIGINVNQRRFLSDAPNPRSLADIVGHDIERRFVLEHFMERFTHYMKLIDEGKEDVLDALHEHYKAHLYRRDEEHKYVDEMGTFCAKLVDVEPSGYLILQDTEGKQRRYEFKQVRFIL